MKIRGAKISDVKAIYSLINSYAERDKMLFRSMADIYENLQAFTVAELDGRVVGCCAQAPEPAKPWWPRPLSRPAGLV